VVTGFGESFRGVLSEPTAIHYLARVDGEAAGALSLFFRAGYGCVYNVGTFQQYRGRGIDTTLLLQLIEDAAHLGVDTLFLQALHHGPAQPLYQRVGFRTRFVRQWYLPDAPGGIWSPASQAQERSI
jgi:ribosomal protein S18 acetylase RimI-like enzyme